MARYVLRSEKRNTLFRLWEDVAKDLKAKAEEETKGASKDVKEKAVKEAMKALPTEVTKGNLCLEQGANEPTIEKLYKAIFKKDKVDSLMYRRFRKNFFREFEPLDSGVRSPTSYVDKNDKMLWMRVDHSKAGIELASEKYDECIKDLRRILWDEYGIKVAEHAEGEGPAPIKRVKEESGSVNYRVECEGENGEKRVLLFRVHKSIKTPEAIEILHRVQKHVCGVFLTFGDRLKPIESKSGKEFVRGRIRLTVKEKGYFLITVFLFADVPSHYSGKKSKQIASLAKKYGAVQRKLRDLYRPEDLSFIREALQDYTSWYEEEEYGDYIETFDLVDWINRVAVKDRPQDFTLLWDNDRDFLKHAWLDV